MRASIRVHARRPSAGVEQIGVAQFSVDLERTLVVQKYGADRRRPAFGAFLDRIGHASRHRGCDRACEGAGGGNGYFPCTCPLRNRAQADREKTGDRGTNQRRLVRKISRPHEACSVGFCLQLHYPFGTDRRCASARDVARVHGAIRGVATVIAAGWEQAMTSSQSDRTLEIADGVPPDSLGAAEIGFAIPQAYNASRILFDNLLKGRGDRPALTGPAGTHSYGELCAEASRWGHGFQSLGLKRGDRIMMFLDDTPAYPAAFFGAVRAGFVPLLINTLTPPDLLQFYLSDSGATVAVADAEFCSRFDAVACKETALRTLVVVNGAAGDHAAPNTTLAEPWLQNF